jgi:DNA-binding CsgD family transcriptional regulator
MNRWKELIKIKADINEMGIKKYKESMKQKLGFLKR